MKRVIYNLIPCHQYNVSSSIVKQISFNFQEEIVGLEIVEPLHIVNASYPTGKLVNFTAIETKGSNVTYEWEIKGPQNFTASNFSKEWSMMFEQGGEWRNLQDNDL